MTDNQVDRVVPDEEQQASKVVQLPGTERLYDHDEVDPDHVQELLVEAGEAAREFGFDQCVVILRNSRDLAGEDYQVMSAGSYHAESLNMLTIAEMMIKDRYKQAVSFGDMHLPDGSS